MASTHASSDSSPPHFPASREPQFMGYHRANGRVGTRNYWLVIPLFVGDIQQLAFLQDALLTGMGYSSANPYLPLVRNLQAQYRAGSYFEADASPVSTPGSKQLFTNIDGIKFLPYHTAPGESPVPHESFWEVLAGYCSHPNVGGITVLNQTGDQYIDRLRQRIYAYDANFAKTVLVTNRHHFDTTFDWFAATIRDTFRAMAVANRQIRRPAPLSSLSIGLQVVASEKLADEPPAIAHYRHFLTEKRATVLYAYPDASRISPDEANYPFGDLGGQPSSGLTSCSLPGSIAERTTALTAAGCTLHLTTTDVGLPVGNPIAPVMHLTTNPLAAAWFDIDGSIGATGQLAQTLLHQSLRVASGEQRTEAEQRRQDTFSVYAPR